MPLGHYCPDCKKVVLTRYDMFRHPHEGMKSCLVCRECGAIVYVKNV